MVRLRGLVLWAGHRAQSQSIVLGPCYLNSYNQLYHLFKEKKDEGEQDTGSNPLTVCGFVYMK